MKDQLTSLDLFHLARELQVLVGARLDKAYQGVAERKRDLTLSFHTKGEKHLLRLLLPGLACLVGQKPGYEQVPGDFAVFLRRHVGNARVVGVAQRGFDRILELTLENKDGRFLLVVEFQPPGNALLLNADRKIINLLEPRRLGQRVLRGGAVYETPDPPFDTAQSSEQAIAERLFVSTKDSVVKSLAIDLGLGGEYAEEACARAGIEKARTDLTKTELATLASAVLSLFGDVSACAAGEEVFPIPMRTRPATASFPSLSAAIEHILIPAVRAAPVEKSVPKRSEKTKAEEVLRAQELALKGLLTAAGENQRKGELLYERYQEVATLLSQIREARSRMTWQEIKAKVKNKRIVKIDEQKGEVTIELE